MQIGILMDCLTRDRGYTRPDQWMINNAIGDRTRGAETLQIQLLRSSEIRSSTQIVDNQLRCE